MQVHVGDDDLVAEIVGEQRVAPTLAAAFSLLALLLAAVGTCGVISYAVGERRRGRQPDLPGSSRWKSCGPSTGRASLHGGDAPPAQRPRTEREPHALKRSSSIVNSSLTSLRCGCIAVLVSSKAPCQDQILSLFPPAVARGSHGQ